MQLTWNEFKTLLNTHNLSFYYEDNLRKYSISAYLGEKEIHCSIHKEQEDFASDKLDFETNYKSKGNIPSYYTNNPFASKRIGNYKLFRRKHVGLSSPVTIQAGQSANLDFTVPYPKCKMTAIEIIGCREHDQASLSVLMGATVLNQFGFDVALPDGIMKDESDYDADLVANLTIRVTIKNNQSTEQKYNYNITLHELVSI